MIRRRRAPGPDGRLPLLAGLKDWMSAHNAVIMAVLCLVIAAKLIGDGISGLAGLGQGNLTNRWRNCEPRAEGRHPRDRDRQPGGGRAVRHGRPARRDAP
jgi:hypothetical protein